MDITQITRLEEQGETLALHSGIPLSLQDPDKVWVVLEGKLDLYLVEMRDGEPAGARHHFMRVEAGNPVMGFDKLPDAAFGVIANPAVGSKVLCLQLKQLQQAAAGSPESVLPFIEKWVENLGSAMADKPAPKNFHILAPGTEILGRGQAHGDPPPRWHCMGSSPGRKLHAYWVMIRCRLSSPGGSSR